MNDSTLSRARLVELLWQLKQQLDSSGGTGDIRFVHFNTLLNDPAYRAEVIRHAASSSVNDVRTIGMKLVEMNERDGSLLSGALHRPASMGGERADDPSASTTSDKQSRTGGLPVMAILLLAVVGAAGYGGWLYYQDLKQALSGVQIVSGVISENQHWQKGVDIKLRGLVFVESGAQLTIDPGVQVLGQPGSALIVTRGAKLLARGTADQPIVFTSAQSVGLRNRGDWGGIVLLGSGLVNRGNAHIEGVDASDPRGAFGGNDVAHNCGILEYVRVEFAGFEISKDNELNGLTLGGCGSDTIVRFVQVHRGKDDGIELFGGNANLQNVVITGVADDSLDWDMGWRGNVQFLIAQQHNDVGDSAFEGDSNKADHDAEPRSAPTIYNATLISPRSRARLQRAMTIRSGSVGRFNNFIVSGFSGELIDLRGASTARLAAEGDVTIKGLITHTVANFEDELGDADDDNGLIEKEWLLIQGSGLQLNQDPALPRSARDSTNPSFVPARNSPAMSGGQRPPQGEFWDESATWLGAVKPGSIATWLDGWTSFPAN